VIVASLFIACSQTWVFLWLVYSPKLNPLWFYISSSLSGIVSYLGTAFPGLSDTVALEFRASSFGLFLACFYGGFSFAPSIALLLSPPQVSALAFLLTSIGFLTAFACLPETISREILERNISHRELEVYSSSVRSIFWRTMQRPFREVLILNVDWTIRLVSCISFFSSMGFAADATILVYYIEDELNVRQGDFASMFFVLGVFGILTQATLLQPLTRCLGEKGLLILTYCSGTLHSYLCGAAWSWLYVHIRIHDIRSRHCFGCINSTESSR
jgi:Na+/melibiose symporter-like transporter